MNTNTITILCEGGKNSLDIKIYQKLLPTIRPIVPLGSKFGSAAFIKGYARRGGVSNSMFTVGIKDRDFDVPFRNLYKNAFVIDGKPNNGFENIYIYATYRTTIENYLIDKRLVFKYINQYYPSVTELQVNTCFTDGAKLIQDYTAIRYTLGEIRKAVNLENRWTENSGILPEKELLLSFEYLKAEGLKLLKKYHEEIDGISESIYDDTLTLYKAIFGSVQFWEKEEYLIWFQGKDLATAIQWKFKENNFDISWDNYYRWAIEQTDFTQFEDLNALKQIIENIS